MPSEPKRKVKVAPRGKWSAPDKRKAVRTMRAKVRLGMFVGKEVSLELVEDLFPSARLNGRVRYCHPRCGFVVITRNAKGAWVVTAVERPDEHP